MPFLPGGLSPVGAKPLTATFDAGRLSSDGGLIVLREIADRLGLAETITAPLRDERDPTRVRHSYAEMATTRMLMIAAGYEDSDDVDALRTDPALKIAVGRCPESGADLMSQPTLSRLENLAGWRALARIGLGQIDLYCKSFARPPARVVLDIDDTAPGLDPGSSPGSTSSTASRASPCCRFCAPASGLRRGGGEGPASRDPADPQALAAGRHPRAWRQPLLQRAGAGAAGAHALRLHHRLRDQLQTPGDCGAMARAMRHAPFQDETDPAPVPSAALSCPRMEPLAQARRARRATSIGTDVRFVVTSLEGRGKTLYEKVFAPAARPRT